MKNFTKVLSLVMVLVIALMSFTGCASIYSKLEKAFGDKGYKVNEKLSEVADKVKAELNKEDYAVELHFLTKDNNISSVLIVEFKSTKELAEAYEKSETVKGFVKDVKNNEDVNKVYDALVEAGYASGNCLVLPLTILYINEVTNVVKSVK